MSKMRPPGPPPGRPPSKVVSKETTKSTHASSSGGAHGSGGQPGVLLPNGMILPMMPGLAVSGVAVPRGPDAPSEPDPLIPKAPPPAPLPEEDAPALPDEPHPDGEVIPKVIEPEPSEEPKKKKKKRPVVEGLASNKKVKTLKTGVTVFQNMTEELTVRGERDGVIAAKRAKVEKNALPAGWVAQKSKSTGKIYYVHAKTKQTTWERPKA